MRNMPPMSMGSSDRSNRSFHFRLPLKGNFVSFFQAGTLLPIILGGYCRQRFQRWGFEYCERTHTIDMWKRAAMISLGQYWRQYWGQYFPPSRLPDVLSKCCFLSPTGSVYILRWRKGSLQRNTFFFAFGLTRSVINCVPPLSRAKNVLSEISKVVTCGGRWDSWVGSLWKAVCRWDT